jgi:ribosomal protein S18
VRAQGIKVKDDPTLLQKTIKKKAKIKEKRKETWQEREQKIEKVCVRRARAILFESMRI